MSEENNYDPNTEPDLVTVSDEDGVEQTFEILDRIETDDARYIALTPAYETEEEMLKSEGELIVLRVEEEDGETYLCPIEDEKEFNRIGDLFEERLADLYDFGEEDAEEGAEEDEEAAEETD